MMGLLMALGKRAQYALRDLSLESWSGENALPAFRLYIGALPGLREDPRREDFPMLLLRLLDFSDGISGEKADERRSVATVRILCGVWSEDDGSGGYHDLLNALSRMRLNFLAHPLLESKWRLTGKLEGNAFEDQAFPYWFGDLITRWELRHPVEEFETEEEIDTYGSAYGNDQTRNWRHPGDAPDGIAEERYTS